MYNIYMKHLEGDIWELRPIRNRILFASWTDNGFILLHYFIKKTQKTPRREIDKAIHNLQDISERNKLK
jgi:phage-related protein